MPCSQRDDGYDLCRRHVNKDVGDGQQLEQGGNGDGCGSQDLTVTGAGHQEPQGLSCQFQRVDIREDSSLTKGGTAPAAREVGGYEKNTWLGSESPTPTCSWASFSCCSTDCSPPACRW